MPSEEKVVPMFDRISKFHKEFMDKYSRITMIIGTNVNLVVEIHLQLLGTTIITPVRSDFAIIKKKWKWS